MSGPDVVRMGEIESARPPRLLAAIGLGSCIAVVLHDPEARVGGIAHVVLPARGAGCQRGGEGRYAVSAIPALVDGVAHAGASRSRLIARLAGGARMFNGLGAGLIDLGERNLLAVREALARVGIPIVGEWVGGDFGRSLFYDPGSGEVRITSVGHGTRRL
jgi:chemotaxis protein CheD